MMTKKKREDFIKNKVATCIAGCLLPLSIVENPFWREMTKAYMPAAQKLTSESISKELDKMEKSFREEICEQLAGESVCFTIDHWSSIANQNFTGINAHWINQNWEMQSDQLGCFLHEGTSESEKLLNEFIDMLHENAD